jgi:hypothetical protein
MLPLGLFDTVCMTQDGNDDGARLRKLADEYEVLAAKEFAAKFRGWEQRARLLRQIAAEMLEASLKRFSG